MLTPSSPSTSSSLVTQDQNHSRKRQRSQSMQSEPSSSSPKRAASEESTHDIRSPQSQNLSTLSITDSGIEDDIDSYMADQGEPPLRTNSTDTLSPADKLSTVGALSKAPMKPGETWYLVSWRWYKRWRKAMSGEVDKEGPVLEKDIGPVDNSSLVDPAGNLVSPAIEHVDVEFVPEAVWLHFVDWYGQPNFALPRQVIVRGITQEPALELHPRQVKLHILTPIIAPGPAVPPRVVTISVTDSIKSICETFYTRLTKKTANGEQDTRLYRVWKLAEGSWDHAQCTPEMLKQRTGTILEPSERTAEDEMIESGDAFTIEFQIGDEWLVGIPEVPVLPDSASSVPQSTTADVAVALFTPETDFFSQMQANAPSSSGAAAITSKPVFTPAAFIKAGSANTRPKGPSQEPGTLGLGNLGNTCFMNSALQCLAHTQELADYFLTGVFEEELNPDNPLGMQGAIAQTFGALLRRIWGVLPSGTSYSPREFKQALQRFAPQFSGYQQHDSQELVAFLLDGLHEDLNRVLKKPYVEKPDWEGGGDKELVELANASWEGYMKRNDSVIVDLFQGQYQSTLVCPVCQKVSITFDPFMYLTLPLPVVKKWRHTVFYVPWHLKKPHVKIPVEISRDASFRDLRQLLGRWMDADPDKLLTLEVFSSRFYKDLDDTCIVGDMADNDIIVCFELPCHAQQSRTYKPQPTDPFIVPVIMCDLTPRINFGRSQSLFGYPFVIVVDRKQATDIDAMAEAVLERLQRWTANVRDLFNWEAGSSSSMEEVHIPIGGPPPVDSVTEIKENGEIVTVQEAVPEEGDITDEKGFVVQEQEYDTMDTDDEPRKIGFKKNIFRLSVQAGNSKYGIGYGSFGGSSQRYDSWDQREAAGKKRLNVESPPVLLQENDVLFCEFDENMKAYYFGDDRTHWEHAEWITWKEYHHPEYTAARKAEASKTNKGITLQDCLDEFTREEKLGEDDLWYCPRCKKHQQATKRFDLWKVPDVLVVHLKRFSNSRTLRDKIDTFVDFPLEGLDLSAMVGERQVAKRLIDSGADVGQLGLRDLEEPPIYDLYAVDEHLGGLGGGHYRAYALNQPTGQWYHFDDSYVSPVKPDLAVNSNAYLLFYKRRTSRPLGGKSYARVEAARNNPKSTLEQSSLRLEQDSQLPTPPRENNTSFMSTRGAEAVDNALTQIQMDSSLNPNRFANWPTPQSNPRSSPASSSSPVDDINPPAFEDAQYDDIVQSSLDPLALSAHQFDFPDPSSRHSPTSSNEGEPDLEPDNDSTSWSMERVAGPKNRLRLRTAQFARSGASSPEGSSTGDYIYTHQSVSDDDKEDSSVSRDETSLAFSAKYQRMSGDVPMRTWGKPAAAADTLSDIDM